MPDAPIPDFYVDGGRFFTNLFGCTLTLGVADPQRPVEDGKPQAVVLRDTMRLRASPAFFKILALTIRAELKPIEAQGGHPIPVSPDVLKKLNMKSAADW